MQKGTAILLGVGAIGIFALGSSYVSAVNNLSITPVGVAYAGFDNSGNLLLNVEIAVQNPSALPIPVPSISADLYSTDATGAQQHLASGASTGWQKIAGNTTSNLYVVATIAAADVVGLLASLIATKQLPANLSIAAIIHLPIMNVPVNANIVQLPQISLPS